MFICDEHMTNITKPEEHNGFSIITKYVSENNFEFIINNNKRIVGFLFKFLNEDNIPVKIDNKSILQIFYLTNDDITYQPLFASREKNYFTYVQQYMFMETINDDLWMYATNDEHTDKKIKFVFNLIHSNSCQLKLYMNLVYDCSQFHNFFGTDIHGLIRKCIKDNPRMAFIDGLLIKKIRKI
jgi:hypothetical protein